MCIKILIMDVDGTLTDGKIYIGENGEIFKVFNIKDGYGIKDILNFANILPVVITGRSSPAVANRCRELGISEVYQGVSDKKSKMIDIINNQNVLLENVAFIGDDLNDLCCINTIKASGGLVGCPADAVDAVKARVDFIAPHNGGQGAVRDFIEWILQKQKTNQSFIGGIES